MVSVSKDWTRGRGRFLFLAVIVLIAVHLSYENWAVRGHGETYIVVIGASVLSIVLLAVLARFDSNHMSD